MTPRPFADRRLSVVHTDTKTSFVPWQGRGTLSVGEGDLVRSSWSGVPGLSPSRDRAASGGWARPERETFYVRGRTSRPSQTLYPGDGLGSVGSPKRSTKGQGRVPDPLSPVYGRDLPSLEGRSKGRRRYESWTFVFVVETPRVSE